MHRKNSIRLIYNYYPAFKPLSNVVQKIKRLQFFSSRRLFVFVESVQSTDRHSLQQLSCEWCAVTDHEVANRFHVFLESGDFGLRFAHVHFFLFFGITLVFFQRLLKLLVRLLLVNFDSKKRFSKSCLRLGAMNQSNWRLLMLLRVSSNF